MKLKDLINEKVLDDLRKNDKSQYKDIQSKYNKYQSILKDVRKIQRDFRVSLIGADEGELVLRDLVTYSSSAAPVKDLKYQFHSSSSRKNNRHINNLRAFSYMIESRTLPDNGAVFIPYVSGDLIYARLKDDQLAKVQSVEFSIEESEEFIKQTAGE